MSYLGKRKLDVNAWMRKNTGKYRKTYGAPAGTGYRSYKRVFRRGPYRTGGFYGSAVRSPQEKKVIDGGETGYYLNQTGSVQLINGAWSTK